jgi:hypothetical protein
MDDNSNGFLDFVVMGIFFYFTMKLQKGKEKMKIKISLDLAD